MNSRKLPYFVAASAVVLGLAACGGQSEAELTTAAKTALAAKDTKGAVIHLKNALQKNPESAEARFLLGKALLESGDPVAALVELRKAQELQTPDERVVPEIARAMLLVGEEGKLVAQYGDLQFKDETATADLKASLAAAYAMQGNMQPALKAVADALRAKPGFAAAVIVQSRINASEGDLDGAITQLNQVLAREPGNDRAGMLKGEILWHGKRDTDAALAAFRSVLNSQPGSVAAHAAVAALLFEQQKLPEVRAEYEALKKLAPNHPETLYLEAQIAFADKSYKATREVSDRILKAMPNNVRVLELAGAAEFRMKNYIQAEALLSRALKVAPKQALSRLLLAQTYLRSAQPDKAIEALRPMVETTTPSPQALSLAGEAYVQLGDNKRSEEAFQRALKGAPSDPRVRTAAAIAQLARGNTSGGTLSELEAIAAGDSGPRADLALVSARLRQGDVAGALKAIDTLEKKMPDQPLPHNLRGRVLVLKKDLPGATKSFEAALTKDPAYFPALAGLAALDVANGKPAEARKRFENFLQAQPKSYQAKLALAELDARTGAAPAQVTATLREAVKLNAAEPAPHLVLINQLISSGDPKAALVAAQEAAAALPNNADILDALGRAQLLSGDSQRAVSTFKQLTAQQPRNPMHQLRLADAYMSTKDYESASSALRRAAELQPDMLAPKRGLAMVALANNKPQEAVAIARELQQKQPKEATGFLLEAEAEASRKGWDAAASAYRNALQRAKVPDTAVRLHMALTASGKTAEADRLTTEWLKDNPKDVAFRYYLGDLALSKNDLVRSESQYRAVLEVQPDNALAMNNIAWLLVKQGKPGAVAMAEKANSLLPNKAPLVDTLAVALEADNQIPQAIEAQKRAVALQPKDGNLTLRLAKLYIKSGDKARARAELEALSQLGNKFAGQAEVSSLLKTL